MKALALVFLTACGGAPFTMAPYAQDDGGPTTESSSQEDAGAVPDALPDPPPDATPDTFKVEHDAAPEAQTFDASPDVVNAPDATPDVRVMPEAAPTCTPFANMPETCPAACGGSCGQPMAAPSVFFRASPANYMGCAALQTPSACTSCREDFTCACIVRNWTASVAVCGSTTIVATCDDSSGVPVFTCH